MEQPIYLSVVIPVFNEEENLAELYQRLSSVLDQVKDTAEIIFVDDGSTDNSLSVLNDFRGLDGRVKVVRLKHNYGQQAALMAGLEYSKGDVVITMDADLQNDPYDIPKFLAEIDNGYDSVYGWRQERKDPLFTRKIPSFLANLLISMYSGKRLHDYGCNLKAFSRNVVEYVNDTGEMGKTSTVLGAKYAAKVKEVKIGHSKRKFGESKYSFSMLISLAMDIITGYSSQPFQVIGMIGVFSFAAGLALDVYYIVNRFILQGNFEPRLFVVALLLPFIGLQFMTLGFLGEFVIRIYNATQKKPIYKVKEYLS